MKFVAPSNRGKTLGLHLIAPRIIVCFLLVACGSPVTLRADYGERLLAIRCDTRTAELSIRPFITWNEESDLEPYRDVIKNGKKRVGDTIYFAPWHWKKDPTVHCVIDTHRLEIVFKQRNLTISDRGKVLCKKEIGFVWDAFGATYELKFSKGAGWQECCGVPDGTSVCAELSSSRTVDCR